MTPDDRLLVHILAATDAAWAPMRQADWGAEHAATNLYAAQRAFPSQGVIWQPTAEREADRRAEYRHLERLAAGDLLEILPTRRKAPGVRLTLAGEWRARSLASLPTLDGARLAAAVVADVQVGYTERVWVNECVVLGGDYDDATLGKHHGRRLWAHQSSFYPILLRRIVAAASDVHGRVYYTLALDDDQIAFVTGPAPEPPADLPSPDREAADVYLAAWTARREELRSRPPDNAREAGPCPLPCGAGMVIPVADWDREPRRRRARKTAVAKPIARKRKK